jgi:ribosomal protein S6--L-glutamate ligase
VRLLLLTARLDLQTNSRFKEAADALGVELQVSDANTLSSAQIDGPTVFSSDGGLEPPPDCVMARVGNWRPESVLAVLEGLVDSGVATVNPPQSIRVGRDHWSTVRALAAASLPVPPTIAGADPEALARVAVKQLGLPLVVKQRRSRMGVGVIRCSERDQLEAVLDSLWRVGDEIVVQRWVPGGESSVRVLVAGRSVVASARFQAAEGEWRSNGARGGSAGAHIISPDEGKLALDAAEALGLGQCGVDILEGDDGPVVVEVNPTPGFLRLEEATGVDVASALVADAISRV